MTQLFRPVNLLIIAITQYFMQYLVIIPALSELNSSPALSHFHFFLLVIATILVAAGGYVINDLIDYKADLINKPQKVFIEKFVSKNSAWIIYWAVTFVGAAISWFLANYVHNLLLFTIYPVAVLLLFLYSYRLKKLPLYGNIIVSIFCAGVAGLVLFAEREQFIFHSLKSNKPLLIFTGYIAFAFITTIIRELIKDVEDIEGDRLENSLTFPVKYGIQKTKNLILATLILLILLLITGIIWLSINEDSIGGIFAFIAILLPSFLLFQSIKKSKNKTDFSKMSQSIKWIMLAGLILLSVIWKF